MQKIKKLIPIGAALLPFIAFAAQTIQSILSLILTLINTVIPVVIAIAVLVFLWGVISFVTAGGDETKRANAKNIILYGIIGLFVMVAVWGLVNVLVSTFNLDSTKPITPSV